MQVGHDMVLSLRNRLRSHACMQRSQEKWREKRIQEEDGPCQKGMIFSQRRTEERQGTRPGEREEGLRPGQEQAGHQKGWPGFEKSHDFV